MLGTVAGVVLSCLMLQVAVGGGPVYCQPGQVRQPLAVFVRHGPPCLAATFVWEGGRDLLCHLFVGGVTHPWCGVTLLCSEPAADVSVPAVREALPGYRTDLPVPATVQPKARSRLSLSDQRDAMQPHAGASHCVRPPSERRQFEGDVPGRQPLPRLQYRRHMLVLPRHSDARRGGSCCCLHGRPAEKGRESASWCCGPLG